MAPRAGALVHFLPSGRVRHWPARFAYTSKRERALRRPEFAMALLTTIAEPPLPERCMAVAATDPTSHLVRARSNQGDARTVTFFGAYQNRQHREGGVPKLL